MADQPLGLDRLLGPEVGSARLVEELRGVIDPELGVNIVDLGLVYGAQMVDGIAHVLMTTTTPACPIGSYLRDEIRWSLLRIDRVLDVDVELTHEPPWSPDRMSDGAKEQLGWNQ